MLPDIEAAVIGALGAHAALVRLGVRVVGRTPETTDEPWVLVRMLDARAVARAEHLTNFMLQLDCYAGKWTDQDEAMGQARDVMAQTGSALGELEGATLPDVQPDQSVVVNGVRIVGRRHLPDGEFEPSRERYVLTVEVYAHPV